MFFQILLTTRDIPFLEDIKYIIYPPTPLPCLRGRRKGRAKHGLDSTAAVDPVSQVPLGVPKAPLRPLGNDRFLLCLSPDLDGVQPFRIHCQAAAVVRLSGLGCVTFFANDWCFFLFL